MTSRDSNQWSCGAIPLVAPETLNDVLAAASDLSIVVSDMGHVLSVLVNPSHPSFGKLDTWIDRDIRETLTTESVPKFDARLSEFIRGEPSIRPVELNHHGSTGMDFPIRYTFHRLGPDGAILLMGRDLRAVAEMQQQLVEAQVALERDYEGQREVTTRMRVLMETVGEAIVFVRLSTGRISEINGIAARLLGGRSSDLNGALFGAELAGTDGDVIAALVDAARTEDGGEAVRLTARRSARALAARVTLFRAAGERMMLCRIEAAQDADAEGDDAARLGGLYDKGVDAMVFTDRGGRILSVNDAFLGLLDLENAAAARGRNLSDFLLRGGVDLKVLVNNALRSGQMKLFATRMVSDFGTERTVEIAATFLADDEAPSLGYVIREMSRLDAARGAAAGSNADEGMRSARELVGAASLKEIVSETSDVVEKMCIETAVELTGNNRVAAAEMLGLSRQSLYVKLRKYDLLARDKA